MVVFRNANENVRSENNNYNYCTTSLFLGLSFIMEIERDLTKKPVVLTGETFSTEY